VLCQDVVAPLDLPPFTNSAMDGYAVRSQDTARGQVRFQVIGRAMAGSPLRVVVGPGEAVAIATGAPLPEGADTVVPVEDVETDSGAVIVRDPVPPGRHVRRVGEDVSAGSVALRGGQRLGPGQLAAAAALGLAHLWVHPRPRVAIVPTGDEVQPAGTALGPGQVFDAISAPLAALIDEAGAVALPRPVAADDPQAVVRAIREAAGMADAVITVGGASGSEGDAMHMLATRHGSTAGDIELTVHRVALRPAKPFVFGRVGSVPLFGLPGNPAAALASFEELVRPALLRMLGRAGVVRREARGIMAEPFDQTPGRLHLVRVEAWRDGGRLWVRPAGGRGSGMIHSLARATGWAVVPAGLEHVPAGTEVAVRILIDPA
jgi:molybdopterin molybdotransferase